MLGADRFDREYLQLRPLSERGHALYWCMLLPPATPQPLGDQFDLCPLAQVIASAHRAGLPTVLFLGAHPLKLGLQRHLIDLVERRLITHFAINGAGLIHDFELALVGGTSEDVPRWLSAGQFGLWEETSPQRHHRRSRAQG